MMMRRTLVWVRYWVCHASVHDWHGKAWATTVGQKRADLWDTFSVRSFVLRVFCECVWIERGTLDGEAFEASKSWARGCETVELRGTGLCIMHPPRNVLYSRSYANGWGLAWISRIASLVLELFSKLASIRSITSPTVKYKLSSLSSHRNLTSLKLL